MPLVSSYDGVLFSPRFARIERASMIIRPVILAGGSGTRLWPASRQSHPKQLLALTGPESLLQETATRLRGFPVGTVADPVVVTNEEYRFIVADQLREVGVGAPQVVLEPVGRNTAPALTLAALLPADPDGRPDPPDHAVRPSDRRCPRLPCRRRRRRRAGRGGHGGHLRHRARSTRDRLRLHPGGAAGTRGTDGPRPGRVRRRSPTWRPPSAISRAATTSGTAASS